MPEKKPIEKRLPAMARLFLAFIKISGKYFPFIAKQIILNRFYHPIRFTKKAYYPSVFKQAKEFNLKYNRKKVVYYSWGQGPVVLLCHGWSGWAGQMGEFVPPLLTLGYSVLAFDGPAHGKSSGTKTNQLEFVEIIKGLEEKYGPFKAIIGHSYGGVCTLNAIQDGVKVEKAVIIGTPASLPYAIEEYRQKVGLSKESISVIPQHIKVRTGKEYHEFSAEYMAQFVSVPVFVIHDKDDSDVTYQDAHRLSAILKQSNLHITAGKGHRRILRDKEVIEKVVDFVIQT